MSTHRIQSVNPIKIVLAQAGTFSYVLDMKTYNPLSAWSIQSVVAGTTTSVTVSYAVSNDGVTFTPAMEIFTEISAGSGFDEFQPPICRYIKIIVTENNTGTATVDQYLVCQ